MLARHSTITLTMDRYSHTVLGEQSEAVEALPSMATATAETLRATGTDATTTTAGETVLASSLAERSAMKPDTRESAMRAQDAGDSEADSVLAFCLALLREKLAVNDDSGMLENGVVGESAGDEKTPENTEFPEVSEGGWGGIRTPVRITPKAVFKTAAFDRSATHPGCEPPRSVRRTRARPTLTVHAS